MFLKNCLPTSEKIDNQYVSICQTSGGVDFCFLSFSGIPSNDAPHAREKVAKICQKCSQHETNIWRHVANTSQNFFKFDLKIFSTASVWLLGLHLDNTHNLMRNGSGSSRRRRNHSRSTTLKKIGEGGVLKEQSASAYHLITLKIPNMVETS